MKKLILVFSLLLLTLVTVPHIPPPSASAASCIISAPSTAQPLTEVNVTISNAIIGEIYGVEIFLAGSGNIGGLNPYPQTASSTTLTFTLAPSNFQPGGQYEIFGKHYGNPNPDCAGSPQIISVSGTWDPGGGACSGFEKCTNIFAPGLKSGDPNDPSVPNLRAAGGLPGRLIGAFLPAILGLLGFLTVIMIVISGIQFILSSGNPEAAAGARGRLTYAIIGFIIVILAFAILQIINRIFLGTNVVPGA